jgi:hypothetical protein
MCDLGVNPVYQNTAQSDPCTHSVNLFKIFEDQLVGLKAGDEKDINVELRKNDSKNIYQKINDIFSSEKYVYKAEVDIITRSGKIKTKVIGQNRTHIITMDNELISIADIEDIKFSE